ncbi:MAG: BamA/TamA family outer membrane protein, partial [Gammaproteobacteria bacterium]|nr:BamA/TamA family outer membrane protein [Gammaproteobacteria bacterium]
ISASITRARGGLIPASGFSYAATLEGANDWLLSDASFFRLSGNARWLRSFGKHRLLQGLQLGGIALYGSTRLDDIPSSLRFFAGGDQSIRGYDYKSIAPRGSDNELSGGKYLAVTRSEYGYRFARSWRAALFVDAGAAFNDANDKFYLGPGVGLHWLSPIGAVRFDIGVAASEDQSIELHISLGPEL